MNGATVRWLLVVGTAYMVQVAFLGDLRIAGVHPDLMLLVAVVAGLCGGPSRGASIGFAAGLLVDLVVPGRLGTTALAFALVGFGTGLVGESVIRSARVILVGMVMAGSAVGVLLYALIANLLGQVTLTDPRLGLIVGIVSAFNAVLCLPLIALGQWAEDYEPAAAYR